MLCGPPWPQRSGPEHSLVSIIAPLISLASAPQGRAKTKKYPLYSVDLIYDTVSHKGWRLGARRHKIDYDLFSLGEPPKKLWEYSLQQI